MGAALGPIVGIITKSGGPMPACWKKTDVALRTLALLVYPL
jgi:hypothetical protein